MSGARKSWKKAAMALALAAGAGLAAPALGQETQVFHAFAIWHGQGQVVEIGEKRVAIVGALSGVLFIETSEGPVDTGTITCPALITVDVESGRQAGSGGCAFKAHDGARAYGEWECVGVHLVGCRGAFRLTGGTGRLAGISGSSTILFRGRLQELAIRPGEIPTETAIGIAVWRDLRVSLAAPGTTKRP
jgi:hypothetical protein